MRRKTATVGVVAVDAVGTIVEGEAVAPEDEALDVARTVTDVDMNAAITMERDHRTLLIDGSVPRKCARETHGGGEECWVSIQFSFHFGFFGHFPFSYFCPKSIPFVIRSIPNPSLNFDLFFHFPLANHL
ncbi:hypothetical protein niasHT_021753 [Heterodera trifolii]|uniref:Uncharacterized protein n=1 Tax=Heterodera trifolii TaxID=157864 RepID=A0ABD2KJE0_9BILA